MKNTHTNGLAQPLKSSCTQAAVKLTQAGSSCCSLTGSLKNQMPVVVGHRKLIKNATTTRREVYYSATFYTQHIPI
jgi:hypothetical protein